MSTSVSWVIIAPTPSLKTSKVEGISDQTLALSLTTLTTHLHFLFTAVV